MVQRAAAGAAHLSYIRRRWATLSEWLKIMLGEIARKQDEAARAAAEQRLRQAAASTSATGQHRRQPKVQDSLGTGADGRGNEGLTDPMLHECRRPQPRASFLVLRGRRRLRRPLPARVRSTSRCRSAASRSTSRSSAACGATPRCRTRSSSSSSTAAREALVVRVASGGRAADPRSARGRRHAGAVGPVSRQRASTCAPRSTTTASARRTPTCSTWSCSACAAGVRTGRGAGDLPSPVRAGGLGARGRSHAGRLRSWCASSGRLPRQRPDITRGRDPRSVIGYVECNKDGDDGAASCPTTT